MGNGRAVAGVGLATLVVALGVPGACTGNDCAGDDQSWGSCSQGDKIDDNTWESAPVASKYLDFHGGRTWLFDPSPWMGKRTPVGFQAFVSLDPDPYASGGSGFAQSAGNLAEFLPASNPWQVNVENATCAQYYLRVVLTYAATGGAAGTCSSSADAATD